MSDGSYELAPGAPAGWYPLPGGGQRYWDGRAWVGDPVPTRKRPQEPSSPALVSSAILGSLIATPIVGIVMGLYRMRKNRRDAWKMIGWGAGLWIAAIVAFAITKSL